MANKKYMSYTYTVVKDGNRYKWSATVKGEANNGFADSTKQAESYAESWIRGKVRG